MSSRTMALLAGLLLTPAAARAEGVGKLVIQVVGFRNDVGLMRIALFGSAKGFPGKHQLAVRSGSVPIRNRTVRFELDGVPHGTYAVAVLHDENGDGKMNTNWLGIPKEGGGASRDPRARFGPPSFDDARFQLRGPALAMTIRIQYP
jgi:uncharacterized protein (DUF2141 family)